MYWENKCFFCLFWGTLTIIVGLSAKPLFKDFKKKNETVIINNANVGGSTDSTNKM